MPSDWLTTFVRSAPSYRGCTRVGCGTCGAGGFKNAVRDAAIAELRASRGELARGTRFTDEDVVRTVIDGLRQLPAEFAGNNVVRAIVALYRYPMLTHGVGIALSSALEGSAFGRALRREEEYDADWARSRAKQRRAEVAAEKERVRLGQEALVAAAAARIHRKHERDAARSALLAELAALAPAERLRRVATDASIDLSYVPAELLPIGVVALGAISPVVAAALLARIGPRRGPWRRVGVVIRRRYGLG